jgi:hypothetical protein
MKGIYWILFIWFAPFIALITLWIKFCVLVFTLLLKAIAWGFQQVIKVTVMLLEKIQIKYNERKKQINAV